MANNDNGNNSVAIVALIIIGALIAGAAFLYFNGNFSGPNVIERDTTVIERQAPPPAEPDVDVDVEAEEPEDDSGFKLKHEDEDGTSTEIEAPTE